MFISYTELRPASLLVLIDHSEVSLVFTRFQQSPTLVHTLSFSVSLSLPAEQWLSLVLQRHTIHTVVTKCMCKWHSSPNQNTYKIIHLDLQ